MGSFVFLVHGKFSSLSPSLTSYYSLLERSKSGSETNAKRKRYDEQKFAGARTTASQPELLNRKNLRRSRQAQFDDAISSSCRQKVTLWHIGTEKIHWRIAMQSSATSLSSLSLSVHWLFRETTFYVYTCVCIYIYCIYMPANGREGAVT